MCGIVGLVEPRSDQRLELLRAMNERIVHRGPDEDGFFEDGMAALGMRRLSIQDVVHGHQPALNERGDVATVFNGELYNVRELQDLLRARGHHLASESDTECIPHLYEEFGLDFVQHLRGMFAIALWDASRQRLVLVRDRLGKKPLYFWTHAHGLGFASELKALLLDRRIARAADPVAVNHYLTLQYVPAPWSAVEGVSKVPPAHMLVWQDGRTEMSRYWTLKYATDGASAPSEGELVAQLREQLLDAVRVRLISERPLGAFLSGGLDSSAVVAAMCKVAPGRVKTFSIGFEEETHNELPYAARVAQRFGTDHHEMVVKPDVQDLIPRLATYFDEPYADSSAIPSWYLAEMASHMVVVALNGDGGDEALGGYSRYLRYLAGTTRTIPRLASWSLLATGTWIRQRNSESPLIRKAGTAALLLGESDPRRRYARFLSYFRPEEKASIYSDAFAHRVRDADTYALLEELWDRYTYTDPINRLLAVDTHSYLPGDLLPKVDITTMSVSLEARSPFLDQQFVEWAASIPGDRKIVNGSAKVLLKKALEGWIDDDLIHRRKQGFGVPLAEWLRGPLRPLVYDLLTDRTAASRGYFVPSRVRALVDSHMAGVDRSPHVYALLMLEMWHREVLH